MRGLLLSLLSLMLAGSVLLSEFYTEPTGVIRHWQQR
jgi:hypothetical protein